ncbi:DeoR/GlpR family DNA-binding transcription regulator [Mesorhizobium sp. BR1-1-16]|uniref:DeoR/GlpR family DNA-binding transcription regulator n=1 Tax=Mesorhizobium sp. BR1-1-16 TaxID=2876653 RepID=UPI001CCE7333|nr:DeoR/GlpR family DNA-binding transcription regulator [Mesorhizobium sp. BR1-1-16]MBZ9938454.1 DeoR/GlpR family DNA-binding transcription regulator [Mesorhizobium sp. BR1-1-16]
MSQPRRPELIPAQRRATMLELIRKRGAASIQDLAEAIGISMSTVRRDLEHLEERGYLERSHGGAVIQKQLQSTFEPEAAITAEFDRFEKEAIGSAAAATLKSGASVLFDSSSTVLAAARACVERALSLTAVTNDLGIGQVLVGANNMRVVVLGGTVRAGSLTMVGEPGEGLLRELSADVALIGTHAITGLGLSETSLEAAAMKRAMIAAARRVVLLADASKFRAAAFCRICELTDIHELFTDDRADPSEIERVRNVGVSVTVVPSRATTTAAA